MYLSKDSMLDIFCKYYLLQEDEMEDPKVTEKKDVCLLAVLNTSLKIARELSIVRQETLIVHLNQIWSESKYFYF